MLPSDPTVPDMSTFYERPRDYCHLFLLGFNADDGLFYVTSHDILEHPTVRPAYAISSQSVPIPLEAESASPQAVISLAKDMFAFLYATPFDTDSSFASGSSAIVTSLLPTSVRRQLKIDNIRANDIVQQLLKMVESSSSIVTNRMQTIIQILDICDVRVVAGAVIESELSSRQTDSICLTGVVYLESRIGKLYGESVYSAPFGVKVDCYFAVMVANATENPCFMSDALFRSSSRFVVDMAGVYASFGYWKVQTKNEDDSGAAAEQADGTGRAIGELWQLTSEDVLALSEGELRDALRGEGVGVRNDESKQSLMGKVADFMDEVHRRELLIAIAAERGMFDVAAELQRGRSRRGKLLQELRDAEDEGNWGRVTAVAAELKELEAKTQDVTRDPGTYDRDLDQDDWYRPCR